MASTACAECSQRPVSTSARTFPYCGARCAADATRRRARLASTAGGTRVPTPRPPRAGTLRGF